MGGKCKSPEALARRLEYNREWHKRNKAQQKDYARDYNIRTLKARRYNISLETLERMFAEQDGRCKLCSRPLRLNTPGGKKADTACVDHDRRCCDRNGSCGACVRGLLCSPCNMALGLLKDNVGTLQKAVAYLGAP